MIGKANDPPHALPLIAPPRADEFLFVMAHKDRAGLLYAASQLADPYGLSSPSLERLDQTLTFAQAIAMSGFVRLPPDGIIRMTHTNLPADCQTLSGSDTSQQSRRLCGSELKRGGAAGAVLKSWMQGWRVTCRGCGAGLADIWSDAGRAGPTDPDRFGDEPRAVEELIETYAARRQTFQVSPATMLGLLLLCRRPPPQEIRDKPELPRRLNGTIMIIPEFDAIAVDHELDTAIGRSTVSTASPLTPPKADKRRELVVDNWRPYPVARRLTREFPPRR